MTPLELLAECQQRGITLEPDGGMLRYRAPKGVLTADLKAGLVKCKAGMLALLRDRTEDRDLPFPIGYGGLPHAPVEAAEAVMDRRGITDHILRKYNVLSWVRGYYQGRAENHGQHYEAIKRE